ncbi:MAG: hypothetical protein CVU62_07065 [Deltaproteobacteria bacterium HGW-Deltaproteobacteria-2]|nr:MAG: hypothetical protein CVU62_07065 [Deltaproteobacteria bacterium HGW-Deltaproteobacteria-2]
MAWERFCQAEDVSINKTSFFQHDQILVVLAHEIGHWKKKHILQQLIFMIVLSLVGLYFVCLVVNWPPLIERIEYLQKMD